MTRYEAIEQRIARNKKWAARFGPNSPIVVNEINPNTELLEYCLAALALPEDSKVVNAELHGLAVELADNAAKSDIECNCIRDTVSLDFKLEAVFDDEPECVAIVSRAARYLELREQSGDPLPYKVVREGDKIRFE